MPSYLVVLFEKTSKKFGLILMNVRHCFSLLAKANKILFKAEEEKKNQYCISRLDELEICTQFEY